MLHVYIIAAALFLNPATEDMQLIRGAVASPSNCAEVLNANPIVVTDDGPYYMIKSECQGAYVDDEGNIISFDGDAQ